MKIIKIEKCYIGEDPICPFCDFYGKTPWCMHSSISPEGSILQNSDITDWCPLEDASPAEASVVENF